MAANRWKEIDFRILCIRFFLLLCLVLMGIRSFDIQILQGEVLKKKAENTYVRGITIQGDRGHRITSYNVCYTKLLRKLIGINKDIGYLSDHGCPTLGPDRMAMMQGREGNGLAVFDQLVGSRYNIKQIPLKDEGIPEGLNCLVIARITSYNVCYTKLLRHICHGRAQL